MKNSFVGLDLGICLFSLVGWGGVGWRGGHEPKIFGHSSKKYNTMQK